MTRNQIPDDLCFKSTTIWSVLRSQYTHEQYHWIMNWNGNEVTMKKVVDYDVSNVLAAEWWFVWNHLDFNVLNHDDHCTLDLSKSVGPPAQCLSSANSWNHRIAFLLEPYLQIERQLVWCNDRVRTEHIRWMWQIPIGFIPLHCGWCLKIHHLVHSRIHTQCYQRLLRILISVLFQNMSGLQKGWVAA